MLGELFTGSPFFIPEIHGNQNDSREKDRYSQKEI